MNEFLHKEIRKTTQNARSTWDAEFAHDLIEVAVRKGEQTLTTVEFDLHALLLDVLRARRRLDGQDHITSML